MIWQVENTKFFYFFKSTQTYLGRLSNASVYCERRLSKIARCTNFANLYHKFLSRKLLSVDSFQKLDFHISWLTAKILDLLLANPALQDGIFNYLVINTFFLSCDSTLSLPRRVIFFFYNRQIWNIQCFNEKQYVVIFK